MLESTVIAMPLLCLVHEDERLLVLAKPSGQVVIPGRGDAGLPLNRQAEAYAGRRLYVVHRIDREASGLVVFAKDPAAHRELSVAFERRLVRKRYLAVAVGRVESPGTLSRPIREFGSGRMGVHPRGKPARTRWRILRRAPGQTLLEIEPLTGRRHQIRVHLYSIGHPVAGDPLYGGPAAATAAPRLMLHAAGLAFKLAGRRYAFRAEPGADFHFSSMVCAGSQPSGTDASSGPSLSR